MYAHACSVSWLTVISARIGVAVSGLLTLLAVPASALSPCSCCYFGINDSQSPPLRCRLTCLQVLVGRDLGDGWQYLTWSSIVLCVLLDILFDGVSRCHGHKPDAAGSPGTNA
jgi:hypothetical protein